MWCLVRNGCSFRDCFAQRLRLSWGSGFVLWWSHCRSRDIIVYVMSRSITVIIIMNTLQTWTPDAMFLVLPLQKHNKAHWKEAPCYSGVSLS